MKKFLRPYLAFLMMGSLIVTTTSCGDDDDPTPTSDKELITTVKLILEPEKGNLVQATIKDMDGVGGAAPVKETLVLKPNTVYTGETLLLNEQENPAVEIHTEILDEADDHQIFYTPSSGLNLTVAATDKDSQNRPVGLATTFTTGAASTGTLKVVLKHQKGTKAAAPGNANAGETDIEVTFDVIVQQ
ncbi:hypothetical protein [Pontibacter burrus]|uniref:Type 1 periplasmic binding fold superfamily protein n=1 Tax=Pontibacter burrus TaxID=2704466 RepID=A0A6B3LIR1_9BACT|nr:hypothetical protein [Pontibacter burrus]NEM96539.1 hypothetical protein [Pontibacter burrus]